MLLLISDNLGLNLFVTTSVFILVAHEVHRTTNQLISDMLPSKNCLSIAFIFLIVVILSTFCIFNAM